MMVMTVMVETQELAALPDAMCDCGRTGTYVGFDGNVELYTCTVGHSYRVADVAAYIFEWSASHDC